MADRSDAWNAFINNIHNYNVGGDTLGAPRYHSGNKFAHHLAANDAQLGDVPNQPPVNFEPGAAPDDEGMVVGAAMVASDFIDVFKYYAKDYARVRMVTHNRRYQTGGTLNVTHTDTALTAMNATYESDTDMDTDAANASIAAGEPIDLANMQDFADRRREGTKGP